MKMMYAYALKHNPTGKLYVGCSGSKKRVNSHFNQLKRGAHPNKAMQEDAQKYGCNFTAYLLEVFPSEGTRYTSREAYWIRYFDTDNPERGYNVREWYKPFSIDDFPTLDVIDELIK